MEEFALHGIRQIKCMLEKGDADTALALADKYEKFLAEDVSVQLMYDLRDALDEGHFDGSADYLLELMRRHDLTFTRRDWTTEVEGDDLVSVDEDSIGVDFD